MNPLDEASSPKLNPLPFIVGDIVLLLAAALIFAVSAVSDNPFAPAALVAIAACVCLGCVLACIPVVLNYTRRRDAELAARQNQLALLAQTTAATAAKIDRSVASLNDIAEGAAKMHKQAAQLPALMQEKIGEFKAQINEVAITENEALAQEVATLRASETERLDTTLAAIKKTAADLAALETAAQQRASEISSALAAHVATQSASLGAAAQKHSADIRDAITFLDERFSAHTTATVAATAAATKSLDAFRAEAERARVEGERTRVETERARVEAESALADAIAKNTGEALARLDARFAKLMREVDESLRKHEQKWRELPAPVEGSKDAPPTLPPAAKEDSVPPPAPEPLATDTPASDSDAHISHISHSSHNSHPELSPAPDAEQAVETPASTPPPPPPPPPRKRSAPKPRAHKHEEPSPSPDADEPAPPPPSSDDEYSQASPDEATGAIASAISADGVTRLVVTSYIGIGNKLHIRGDGPGLSWDKGVPLQFVSIGKWRWETADAAAPIVFKLYKNDSIECATLGSAKLEPGHQHEVTANF